MGTVTNLDEKIAGTTNPARLDALIKLLELRPERNTPAQSARLAACKRVLEAQPGN